jgi:hypothetical protein
MQELLLEWAENSRSPITLCDGNADIVYMNKKSQSMLSKDKNLIGKSLFDCHKIESNVIIKDVMTQQTTNTYFVVKNGKKKLVYQESIIKDGQTIGISEISVEIPENIETMYR